MLPERPDLHSAVTVQIHLHHQPLETISAIKGILTTFPEFFCYVVTENGATAKGVTGLLNQ